MEGRFGNPAIRFFVKSLRSYCSQSKNKESDKYSNNFFSERGSSADFGFRLDNPTEKFSALKRHLLSFQIRECETQFSSRVFYWNSLWARKTHSSYSCKKLFAWSPKTFARCPRKSENCLLPKIFFLEITLCILRMPFWQLCWELLGKSLKLSLPKSKN